MQSVVVDVLGRKKSRRRDRRTEKAAPIAFVLPAAIGQRTSRGGGVVRGIAGGLEQDSMRRRRPYDNARQQQPNNQGKTTDSHNLAIVARHLRRNNRIY